MLSVNSLLRTFLAGAWVVTPAFAAWFVSGSQSLAAVFLIGAVASLSVFLLYLTLPAPKGNAEKAPRLPFGDLLRLIASRPVLLRVLAISLGSGAHALHGLLHPLIMTGPAHGTLRDVGLFAGICLCRCPISRTFWPTGPASARRWCRWSPSLAGW